MATPHPPPPSWQGAERRRAPRYNIALDVSFGPVARAGTRPLADQLERTVTVNVSVSGLCLYSDILYPIGTTLFCALTLPGYAQPLDILGPVVWFQRVEREAHGYKLGVEFTALSKPDAAALQALFEHPPVVNGSCSKRLLLVDDDEELCLALKLRFESSGFHVITAGDGLEALRKGREERPHAIILDLMLPHLNGYEVCRLLKFDQKFHHIPIILCTARCRREDKEMGLAVGADAYITKPFSGEDLIAKVNELLNIPCP